MLLVWQRDWDIHIMNSALMLTPCTDCAYFGPSSLDVHVLHGGDFKDFEASIRNTVLFSSVTPTLRDTIIGARCARSAE